MVYNCIRTIGPSTDAVKTVSRQPVISLVIAAARFVVVMFAPLLHGQCLKVSTRSPSET